MASRWSLSSSAGLPRRHTRGRTISRGFDDNGNAARGVFLLLVIVFMAGVASGALRLLLGGVIGARGSGVIASGELLLMPSATRSRRQAFVLA